MSLYSMPIMIHLINDDKSTNGDDTIRIAKNYDTNEFDITYTDQNNGEPVTHLVTGLYRARVIDYLYILFKNQALDEQGYMSVQMTIPGMPRVIVSGDKFKDLYYREHFMEAVGSGLDLLENVTSKKKKVYSYSNDYTTPVSRRSTANGVLPQHLFFDE